MSSPENLTAKLHSIGMHGLKLIKAGIKFVAFRRNAWIEAIESKVVNSATTVAFHRNAWIETLQKGTIMENVRKLHSIGMHGLKPPYVR